MIAPRRITTAASFDLLLALVLFAAFQRSIAAAGDTVVGTVEGGGKTYTLAHVYARRQPSMTDKAKTVVAVLMTDNEVSKSIVDDKYRLALTDLARQGKLNGVSVT